MTRVAGLSGAVGVFILVSFFIGNSQVYGNSLPPLSITGSVTSNQDSESISAAGSYQVNNGLGSGTGSANVALFPTPTISLSANGSDVSASVTVTYGFEVLGPTPNVPVMATASGIVVGSAAPPQNDNMIGEALLTVGLGNNNIINDGAVFADQYNATGTGLPPTSRSFRESGVYDLQTNTVYTVTLYALAGDLVACCGYPSELATATLDPAFTIDGSLVDPSQYTIELSSGVGNLAATPVPAALPLFATGVGALGLFGWRRKRKAQANLLRRMI